MTKAVLRVLMKKYVFALLGYLLARDEHKNRIRYSRNSAVKPMAAFRSDLPRCFRILMITLYGASRVEKPVIPIIAGTCPTAILIAEPVMKALIAARVMNSTIQPRRTRPRKRTIAPDTTAKDEAMISAGTSGSFSMAEITTFPVIVDKTATGCK